VSAHRLVGSEQSNGGEVKPHARVDVQRGVPVAGSTPSTTLPTAGRALTQLGGFGIVRGAMLMTCSPSTFTDRIAPSVWYDAVAGRRHSSRPDSGSNPARNSFRSLAT
jgi:hypothetical protein